MKINALGFVEVSGFVAAIEAADAMLKSANVRLLREHTINPGMISVVVEGDLAACRAAVNAGAAAAERVGSVISRHVIGRPEEGTEDMVLGKLGGMPEDDKKPAGKVSIENASPEKGDVPKMSESADITPQQPKAQISEKPAEIKPKTAPDGPVEAVAPLARAVMDFIETSGSKGRSFSEIRKRFPELAKSLRVMLDAEVAAGRLGMTGMRYRKPT